MELVENMQRFVRLLAFVHTFNHCLHLLDELVLPFKMSIVNRERLFVFVLDSEALTRQVAIGEGVFQTPEIALGIEHMLLKDGSLKLLFACSLHFSFESDPELSQKRDEIVLVEACTQEWLAALELDEVEEDCGGDQGTDEAVRPVNDLSLQLLRVIFTQTSAVEALSDGECWMASIPISNEELSDVERKEKDHPRPHVNDFGSLGRAFEQAHQVWVRPDIAAAIEVGHFGVKVGA